MAIDIETANTQVSNVDPSLNKPLPMDLSGIQASVAALSQNVGKFLAERQAAADAVPKPEAPKAPPASTGILGAIRPKVEMPQRNTAQDMAEYQQIRQDAMSSLGIGQDQFDELNEVNAEATTLSKELERLNLEEQQRIYQATGGFQLSGIKGAAENQIKREMGLEKSNVAYQLSVKLGQANLIQGRIDKAEKSFEAAMNYATYKQDQAIADYKWALGFDLELEKADRDYLQQQIDNTYKEKADIRAQKQLELDQIKANYDMGDDNLNGSTNITDILQNAIDQGATPAEAARAAAVVYEGIGIQASQKDLNKWTTQASGLSKTAISQTPTQIKQPVSNQTAAGFGKKVKETSAYIQTLGGRPEIIGGSIVKGAQAVGSFFSGLFGS